MKHFKAKHVKQSALARWLRNVGPAEAFDALVSLLPDAAVFAVDAERRVVAWSAGATALLGFEARDVIGEHCLKAHRCELCMVGCGVAIHGRLADVPLELFRADGAATRLRKSARAFYDEAGAFAGGIEVLVPDRAPVARDPVPLDAVVFHGLVSRDPVMLRAFETTKRVAETDTTVLVRGESGTGKELVARALHAGSARRDGPFVPVNCAALTPSLLESELFGHVRGAFTGAVGDRMGVFEQAAGGTLFLDEVAELPLDMQAKLLRVLEERVLTPVGGREPRPVDVRVVAATHRALRAEVVAGRFREDLMYRLRVVPLYLPPLRARPADIELLLDHFVTRQNARGPRRVSSVAPEAMRALLDHRWPGNVRELRNVVEYAFAVGRGPELQRDELPPELREGRPVAASPPRAVLGAPETPADEVAAIRRALELSGGHVGRAAASLGMSRPTFWRKRRKHQLDL